MTPPREWPALCGRVDPRFPFPCAGRIRLQLIGDLVLEACDFCLTTYHVQPVRDPSPVESEDSSL